MLPDSPLAPGELELRELDHAGSQAVTGTQLGHWGQGRESTERPQV